MNNLKNLKLYEQAKKKLVSSGIIKKFSSKLMILKKKSNSDMGIINLSTSNAAIESLHPVLINRKNINPVN